MKERTEVTLGIMTHFNGRSRICAVYVTLWIYATDLGI